MPDGNKLFLYLLGKAEIRPANAAPIKFNQNKSLALLAYLATTKHVYSRAELAGLLWSKSSEANAHASLRKVLADLRPYAAGHLIITRQELAFNTAAPYWLDVQVFEQHIATSQRSQKANQVLMPESATVLAQATDLYRNNFLTGLHIKHAPVFEEWVLLRRERLRLIALQALHSLSAYYMAQAHYDEAINSINQLLTLEPCQENAHRQLMSILALSGQREAALRQYDICRQTLAEELDITPQDETTALYKRIRANSSSPMPRPKPPSGTTATPLIGREQEIADVLSCLKSPECHLLTLLGIGGIGKTRLVQEIMARLKAENVAKTKIGAVYLMYCAPVQSEPAFLSTLAQSIDYYFSNTDPPRQQLLNYMRHKRCLLILDNFEHLLASVPTARDIIQDILNIAPSIKILVTSRTRLNLQAEYLYRLKGLHTPVLTNNESIQHINWRDYAALNLFIQHIQKIHQHQEITKETLTHIIRICQFVQGMPLAILLAASWTQLLLPAEINAHLTGTANTTSSALDFLTTDLADLPDQHRSMRAIFDHSWQLLSEQEQQVLAALTVFQGGFTYAAAEHICHTSLHTLMALGNHSLLTRNPSGRYEMHALLYQYAQEKLHTMPDHQNSLAEQHGRYFCQQLHHWAHALKGPEQQDIIAIMDVEIANLNAAWEWAATHQQWALIHQAIESLCQYYEWRGRYQEGATICQFAINQARHAHADVANGIKEKTLACLQIWHHIFTQTGDITLTLKKCQGLLKKAEQAGQDTRKEKAFILLRSGILMNAEQSVYEHSLKLYQEVNDMRGAAQALESLGWLAWSRGDYEQMERMHKQSLTLHQAIGNRKGIASNYLWLGVSAIFQGQREGKQLLYKSLELNRDHSHRVDIAQGLYYAGMGLLPLGDYNEAHTLFQHCVDINTDLGTIDYTANIFLGSAKIHLGHYQQGQTLVKTGLEISETNHDYPAITYANLVLGWSALIDKNYTQALSRCEKCAMLCRQSAHHDMLSWATSTMGYAYCGLQQPALAQQHFHQALSIAQDIQSLVAYQFTLPGIVWYLAMQGKYTRANELYDLCQSLPMLSNSRWFADMLKTVCFKIYTSTHITATTENYNPMQDLVYEVARLLDELQ